MFDSDDDAVLEAVHIFFNSKPVNILIRSRWEIVIDSDCDVPTLCGNRGKPINEASHV